MSSIKNISLYIPHIFANFSKEYVSGVFESNEIGKVKNIDFVSKLGHDGKPFNAAYIHFESWLNNISAHNFQERVLNPNKEARLMYEDPWFWIVLENKSKKVVSGEKKTCINLGDSQSISTSQLTPVKEKEINCPSAPSKVKSYAGAVNINLDSTFQDIMDEFETEIDSQIEAEMEEIEAEMEEIEAVMEEEDQYLISIDSRYIESIEAENMNLRTQIAYLQNALYIEQIKSQTVIEAFGKINKE
jgi:hypothetical protein